MAVSNSSPNVDNYFVGKGIVYIMLSGETSWRDVGNVPEFEMTPTLDTLDHFSSRAGNRQKDRSIVRGTEVALRMVMEEMTAKNMELVLMGSASNAPITLVTTADTVSGDATLSNLASATVSSAVSATVQTRQSSSGSYSIGEVISPDQDTGTEPEFTVTHLELSSASVAASGTGANATGITFTGTTGTGTKFTVTGDVSSNTLSNIAVVTRGDYTADLTDITQEPITAVGYTGYKLSVKMGVKTVALASAGSVSIVSANPLTTTSDGDGTGATLNVTWSEDGLVAGRTYNISGAGIPSGSTFVYDGDDGGELDANATATGSTVAVTITGAISLDIFSLSEIVGQVKMVGTNDVGAKGTFLMRNVSFKPSSSINPISDEWGSFEVTGEVLVDSFGKFGQWYYQPTSPAVV